MNTDSERNSQDIFVTYGDEGERDDRVPPPGDIWPLEDGDAAVFDAFPEIAFIVRDWKRCDDRTSCEAANLDDMHCLTIVFRSGWRIPKFYSPGLARRYPPAARAYEEAEAIIAEGDPRLGPFSHLKRWASAERADLLGRRPHRKANRRASRAARRKP